MTTRSTTLIIAGAILFLIGLLQGAIVQSFLNPRMALSAHLTAVQCGMALMIVGVVWPGVALSDRFDPAARWMIIVGMYGLWFGLTLSAAAGAGVSLPIAGAGYRAGAGIEIAVSTLVLGSSGMMTFGWLLFVAGLMRAMRRSANEHNSRR